MPSVKSFGESRSGMKLAMTKNDLLDLAKTTVKGWLKKNQKKGINIDDNEVKKIISELDENWDDDESMSMESDMYSLDEDESEQSKMESEFDSLDDEIESKISQNKSQNDAKKFSTFLTYF